MRYPHQASKLHGATRLGDYVLLTVDSNLLNLSEEFDRMQQADFREQLRRLDADPSVKGVIVASHHPPQSNGAYFYRLAADGHVETMPMMISR